MRLPESRCPRSLAVAFAALQFACGTSAETHHLPPQLMGMTDRTPPIYDDGEMTLYEVRMPVALPVLRPSDVQRQNLSRQRVAPFPRFPWVESDDVRVQVTWMLVNLDAATHDVEILVDPWNEFGRYWPGFTIVDEQNGEALPNLSGIDIRRLLPGARDENAGSTRLSGTFTFEDLGELAADFATVINIIESVTPPPDDGEGDPRIELVNHTFHVDNRQGDTPLTDRYRPEAVPAVSGFDLGLRTTEPANIAIEIAIEIVDKTGERIRPEDSAEPVLAEPGRYYTIGSG
jgi:hypothetical protein